MYVIQRGNNRSPIFICDEDYCCFRDILKEACDQHQCEIHAWVFMTNHIHLLLTPHNENSISKMMQSVGRRYVQNHPGDYRWSSYYGNVLGKTDVLVTPHTEYIAFHKNEKKRQDIYQSYLI